MADVASVRSHLRLIDRPRMVVISWPPALVSTLPDVFVELVDRGAELVFAAKRSERIRIPHSLDAHRRVRGCVLPLRRGRANRGGIELFRFLCDLGWALTPALDDAPLTRRRAARQVLKLLNHPDADKLAPRVGDVELPPRVIQSLNAALSDVERMLPTVPGLEDAIAGLDPDAIFLLSRCGRNGPERDVIKVARRLGIPSALLVWSWDNLSSKAVLNEHPDRVLVWNEVQATEAVEMHGVPRERVSVVGAAKFDPFFEQVEVERRADCHSSSRTGPTILYLASSRAVVKNEAAMVDRWLAALRSTDDPRLREARVVVRPHPGEATKTFESWKPPDDRVVLAKPQDAPLARALIDSDVVVALNTSAELEAGIAGRPVVTFRAGPEAQGQEGSAHFHYLLEANGGFVMDAPDLNAHVRRLAALLGGGGSDRVELVRSAQRFVRPQGITRPVAPIVASEVLELAAQSAGSRQSGRTVGSSSG